MICYSLLTYSCIIDVVAGKACKTVDSGTVCEDCASGYYSIKGATSCDFTATTCPEATYAVHPNQCVACSRGLWSPVGSTGVSSCTAFFLPTGGLLPPFSGTNTNSATINSEDEPITVCPGVTLKFSSCSEDGGSTIDNHYYSYINLRLYNEGGVQVTAGGYNLGAWCGYGASMTYTFTQPCQTYKIRQGCYSSYSCSGRVAIVVTGK